MFTHGVTKAGAIGSCNSDARADQPMLTTRPARTYIRWLVLHPGNLRPAVWTSRTHQLGRQAPVARSYRRAATLGSSSFPVETATKGSRLPGAGARIALDAGALEEPQRSIAITPPSLKKKDIAEPFHVLSRARPLRTILALACEAVQTTGTTSRGRRGHSLAKWMSP